MAFLESRFVTAPDNRGGFLLRHLRPIRIAGMAVLIPEHGTAFGIPCCPRVQPDNRFVFLLQNALRLFAHLIKAVLGFPQAASGVTVQRRILWIAHHHLQARQHFRLPLGLGLLGSFRVSHIVRQETGNPPDLKPRDLALQVIEIPLSCFRSLFRIPGKVIIKIHMT